MAEKWVQVIGVFDSENSTGEISGIQPAFAAYSPAPPKKGKLSLAVLDKDDNLLSEVPVEPEFGSCDDVVQIATFQAFVETPEAAHAISLRLKGEEISRLTPEPGVNDEAEVFGLGPQTDHTVPVVTSKQLDPNATYTLQAREKGDAIWQTIDIGLAQPDAAAVDVNQFPGAKAIEVRVLKSQGFGSVEVDKKEIKFDE